MRRSRSERLALCLGAFGLLGAACVSQDDPGLTVTKIEASLVFGVEEVPEPAPTPIQAAVEQPRPVLEFPDLFVPDSNTPPPPAPDPITGRPAPLCPDTDDVAVKTLATANVNTDGPGNRPREGLYKWRVQIGAGSPDADLEDAGFELRTIRNVQDVPPGQWSLNPEAPDDREVFTYEEVRNISEEIRIVDENGERFETVERFLVTTYLVDTDAFSRRVTQGDVATPLPRTGQPERGVALLRAEVVDGTGEPVEGVDTFEPTNGLTLLQLPVASGEPFQSVAVDGSHGRTVVNQSTTGARDRHNACGDLMEGWLVTTTQNASGQDAGGTGRPTGVFEIVQVIAPQHGGVVIRERIYSQQSFAVVLLSQAQLDPDPLPADGLPRLPDVPEPVS